MRETAPLWALCSVNDEALSDKTDPGFSFEYVDISNVSEGHINDDLETLVFAAAPSRARRIARPGDVIVSTVRTYLRAIARVDETENQRIYSTGFAVLRPDREHVDPRYIGYVLGCDQVMDEIVATSVGVSYPAIQASALHRIRVPFASFDAQKRIADYLDRETGEIDAMIAKLDELAGTLEIRRTAVIDRAFVHTLDAPTVAVHLLADVTVGIVVEPSKLYVPRGTGVPALRGLNIAPGRILSENIVDISHEGHKAHSKSELRTGDVVTVRTGRVGTTAVVTDEWDGSNAIDLVITRLHDGNDARFFYWFLASSVARAQIDNDSVGSVQSHFNVGALNRLRAPLVDPDEQKRIAAHLDEATARIDRMLAKVADLKALLLERRSALITDVVTGRKDIA